MSKAPLRLGIDFGGTKTEIIGLNGDNGKELYRKRVPTPREDYKANLDCFKTLIEEAEKTLRQTGTIGIGIPGSISDDNGFVKNSNMPWMNGTPMRADLEKLLKRETRIENDANCFAVSEAIDGAAQGAHVVFGVIIGTGCGGGFAFNGKAHKGVNGVAGEWGHNPLPKARSYVPKIPKHNFNKGDDQYDYPWLTTDLAWSETPGPICYCGHRNCQELWLSGTGLKMDHETVTGHTLSTHDIITQVRKGNKDAIATMERYYDRMARAIGVVINLVDPDVVVLGGGMSNVPTIYKEVPKIWHKYVTSDVIHTKLVAPIHGDSSGVRGAAWLWND